MPRHGQRLVRTKKSRHKAAPHSEATSRIAESRLNLPRGCCGSAVGASLPRDGVVPRHPARKKQKPSAEADGLCTHTDNRTRRTHDEPPKEDATLARAQRSPAASNATENATQHAAAAACGGSRQ
jgi:hypothetical protein